MMSTLAKREVTVEARTPQAGQEVVWHQQRKWGGTQPVPAIYLRPSGVLSARIKVHGMGNKTVRLTSLWWEGKTD